jgi:YYY domain-containing protein
MLPVISWWLIAQVLGLAVLPLTWRLFARFSGRGYPFTKAFGLLLVPYVLWLGAIFHVLPNDVGGMVFALALVAGVSFWLGRAGWQRNEAGERPLVAWLRANRALVIATEALFAVVLVGWSIFRAYNPDISGTEKPMEFAFINGVLNSRFFPPQDPWLSGYAISYYYFGYTMLGLFIRLSGVDPAVGFNMGVALWYALVMVGAFGVVQMLVGAAREVVASEALADRAVAGLRPSHSLMSRERSSIGWGLLGALCVGFLGNLEGLLDTAYHRGLLPLSLIQWFDIKGLADSAPTGGWTGGFWWWWRASRVIHDKDLVGNSVEVIDEFPFFSFLLGDLHPHVLALPFVLLAVGLAVNLLYWKIEAGSRKLEAGSWKSETGSWKAAVARGWDGLGAATGLGTAGVVLYAVALGSLGFLNTWDFPIYVGLATLGLGAALALRDGLSLGAVGRALLGGLVLGALGGLLYLPFYIGFQSQLGGLRPNLLFPSRFSQFLVMFGPFLVVAFFFLLAVTLGMLARRQRPVGVARSFLATLPVTLLLPVLLLVFLMLGMVILVALPGGASYLQEILNQPGVAERAGDGTVGGLAGLVVRLRLAAPWTWLVLAVLIAWGVGVAWALMRRTAPEDDGSAPRTDVFAVFIVVLALALAYIPEFVYLRDLFGSRMNTVFKFYYQAWVLLGLAAVYGLSRLAERGTPLALRIPALVLAALLLLGGLWYPLAAIPSRADYFRGEPSLDGLRYLQLYNPADRAAIEWLRANVSPDAVVLESSGGSYSPEGAGRVSMSTGNPTLLGWDFHERQWRGDAYDELVAGRPEALDRIYRTATAEELPALLDEWDVDYVYVGALEQNKYGVSDVALGRFDAALTKVYDQDGVRIYAR